MICQCGCGIETSPGRKYRHGHNTSGRKDSPEVVANKSAAKQGKLNPNHPDYVPAHIRKVSVFCGCGCGTMTKPGNRYTNGHASRGPMSVAEKLRLGQLRDAAMADPIRAKAKRAKLSKTRKQMFIDGYINPMLGKERPDLRQRNLEDNPYKGVRISKPQKRLYELILQKYPSALLEYRLKTATSCRYLDIAVLECKLVFEFDGEYWHKPELDAERDDELKSMGWTIVHITDERFTDGDIWQKLKLVQEGASI